MVHECLPLTVATNGYELAGPTGLRMAHELTSAHQLSCARPSWWWVVAPCTSWPSPCVQQSVASVG